MPTLFFLASAALLGGGLIAAVAGAEAVAEGFWLAGTVLGLVASVWTTVRTLLARRASVDAIAVLALAGALWVGEAFAGSMIALMLATGRLLEARAAARADRDLRLLVERTPRTARRRTESTVETVPVERPAGDDVRSGVVNAAQPVDVVATALAADSTYAHVVRLVEQAQASSAPFVRTADRFAVLFVPLTLVVAGAAWALAGTPVRAVAVLVVATPCPLLLAAPVAIMSGLSRAARIGVVVKGGAALEALAGGEVMLLDKTGTLTRGRPEVTSLVVPPGGVPEPELLRLAASLDQVSPHPLASAIVSAARVRGLDLRLPTDVREVHGYGLAGRVDGHDVRLGKASWTLGEPIPPWAAQAERRAALDGCLTVFAAVDGRPAGVFLLEDPVREDAPRMLAALHEAGIRRTVLVTGDRRDVAETVGRIVGVDAVLADHDPADKLEAIRAESAAAHTIMVGDGVNDAPALAAAGVGVALAARGSTASSEAADVVLTVDRVDRLADAILVARRSRRIAVEAVLVGMGLSFVAMLVAAAGYLPPAAGAVLQEGIDVLAIAIALRVLLPGPMHTVSMSDADVATARRLREAHEVALVAVEEIRTVADGLTRHDCDLAPVTALLDDLERDLVPHERQEDEELVPIVARALGRPATAGFRRTHAEIVHQVSRLRGLLEDIDPDDVRPADVTELRRLLYGLYAVCRLHNAQEEEGAFALVPPATHGSTPRH